MKRTKYKYYSNQRIRRTKEKCFFNGVDRVNSNKGYILENCVSCCSWCNFSKSNRTVEEYKNWLQWVKQNV